ncbi:hypothetical protein GCM10027456_31760 [Kineosporia babensis]
MCSGILGAKWVRAAWPDLVAQKAFFLFWVFLLWQTIFNIREVFVGGPVQGNPVLERLVLLAHTPVVPQFELWFLWALTLFFLVSRLLSRVPVKAQLALGFALGIYAFSSLAPHTNLGWEGAMKYYLFFTIGVYCRSALIHLAEQLNTAKIFLVMAGWLVIAIATNLTGAIYLPGIGVTVRIMGLVAGVGLATLAQNLRFIRYLGARTLPIYLAHGTFLTLLLPPALAVSGYLSLPGTAWVLPVLLTPPAVLASILLYGVAIKTPARILYMPSNSMTELVRRIVTWASGQR